MLEMRLQHNGYEVVCARTASKRSRWPGQPPGPDPARHHDPKVDGIGGAGASDRPGLSLHTPIIMVTAMTDPKDVVAGFERAVTTTSRSRSTAALVGPRPLDAAYQGLARHGGGAGRGAGALNTTLEDRVGPAAPQSSTRRPSQAVLLAAAAEHHRPWRPTTPGVPSAEVTVVFIDLRGFTAFAELAEPEEVMAVLRDTTRAWASSPGLTKARGSASPATG